MGVITKTSFFKVLIGSFFIQSAWSFEKMQALGFAAAISPALDSIYGRQKAGGEALARHLGFYNAHPYMASPVLGASIRIEERIASGEADALAAVDFKKKVMGPYGAIGDMFFWNSLRPLASCIGVLGALFWGVWGVVVFLAFYNAFHLWMRWTGLKKGYELGEGVVGFIKSLEMPKWGQRARLLASAVMGLLLASAVYKAASLYAAGMAGSYSAAVFPAGLAVAAVSVYVLSFALSKGLTVQRLIYIAVLPPLIYGFSSII